MKYLLFYFACFFVRSFVVVVVVFIFFTSDVIEYVKGLASPLSSLTHTFVEYDQIIKLFVLITKRVEIFWLSFSFLYFSFSFFLSFFIFLFIYLSFFFFFFFTEHTSIFNSAPLRVVEWVALIRFLFGMWHY